MVILRTHANTEDQDNWNRRIERWKDISDVVGNVTLSAMGGIGVIILCIAAWKMVGK